MSDKPYIERTGGSYVRDPETKQVRLQTPPTKPQAHLAPARSAPAPEPKPAPAEPASEKKAK